MSKRYMIILILVNVLTRLGTGYKIIGGSVPEDRDTIIVIDSSPVNLYFSITNKGITYRHSPFHGDVTNFRSDLLAATVMAAADVQITE